MRMYRRSAGASGQPGVGWVLAKSLNDVYVPQETIKFGGIDRRGIYLARSISYRPLNLRIAEAARSVIIDDIL